MQLDQGVLLSFAGVIGAAISLLFRELLRAKDAHIAELQEMIRYQRGLGGQAMNAAHRAVDLVDKVT